VYEAAHIPLQRVQVFREGEAEGLAGLRGSAGEPGSVRSESPHRGETKSHLRAGAPRLSPSRGLLPSQKSDALTLEGQAGSYRPVVCTGA